MLKINNRTVVSVGGLDFEVLWQDQGKTQKITVFLKGQQIGEREVSHLTDQGAGVLIYLVRTVYLESGLAKQ